jgi:exosortase
MPVPRKQELEAKWRILILLAAVVLFGVLLYRETLQNLYIHVLNREGSSHGVFVPFISAFFIWTRWKPLKRAEITFAPVWGTLLSAVGLLVFYFTAQTPDSALPAISFFLVFAGLVLGLFGKDVFRQVGFAIFFLITMVPVPEGIYNQIAESMKAANTTGSVWLVKALGVPIYREVYNICLPETTLLVAPSCSGIRYLVSYAVFGLAYAFLMKDTFVGRLLVVAATIPIAVIGGILRLSTIFLATHYISPKMAEHDPHVLISWGVFGVVMVGAIALDRLISRDTTAQGARRKV